MTPPRRAFGAPPRGGRASCPAEPVPRWPLGTHRLLVPALRLAAALALLAALPLHAQPAAGEAPAHGLIVRLKQPAANDSPRTRADGPESVRWRRVLDEAGLSAASGRREPRLRPVGRDQQLLEFERPLSRGEAAQIGDKLRQRPDVDWVEPNQRQRRLQAATPSDPQFAQQWWLQPIGVPNDRRRGVAGFQTAWSRANMAPVVVAVLDTGITAHEDLVRVLPGYDFVSTPDYANDGNGRDADPADPGDYVSAADLSNPLFDGCVVESSSWHGTIIAGMLAATWDNGRGGAGMHSGLRVLPVRVAGKCGADVSDIIDGMRWAAGLAVDDAPPNPNPARIVNISFGGSAACGNAYQTAVDELLAAGVVVVAAAGNDSSTPSRPASCRGVVGVVGLNRDGFKTNYSNFGRELAATGLAAPSGDDAYGAWAALADSGLLTLANLGKTTPDSPDRPRYAWVFGTSFAAPQVAGVLAHMLSLNPALSAAQLLDGLRLSARPHVVSPKIGACSDQNPGRCICSNDTCGAGILDAERALIFASGLVLPRLQPEVIDNADIDAALRVASQDLPAKVVVVESSGSGGGAFGVFWLMALFTATLALRAVQPAAGLKGRV
jgi:serine protease